MKRLLLPLGLCFLAITLALVAAVWLPQRALPVVLGVIAGMAASLPASLIIVWRLTRGTSRPAPAPQERPPTVIVVPPAPPAPLQPPRAQSVAPRPAPAPPQREARAFTIIGGQDEAEG
jgi:hypothetical protein